MQSDTSIAFADTRLVQNALLKEFEQNDVGYVASAKEESKGQFIYQSGNKQLVLTAEERGKLEPSAKSNPQKYAITIQCDAQEWGKYKNEKLSLGILYEGEFALGEPQTQVANAELKFTANKELDETVKPVLLRDVMKLENWDGSILSLKLGSGQYRLCFTSQDEKTKEETIKYSDPIYCSGEATLTLDGRCPHSEWKTEIVKAATCTQKGTKMKVCTECGEKGQEIIDIPALGHDWEEATCT